MPSHPGKVKTIHGSHNSKAVRITANTRSARRVTRATQKATRGRLGRLARVPGSTVRTRVKHQTRASTSRTTRGIAPRTRATDLKRAVARAQRDRKIRRR